MHVLIEKKTSKFELAIILRHFSRVAIFCYLFSFLKQKYLLKLYTLPLTFVSGIFLKFLYN